MRAGLVCRQDKADVVFVLDSSFSGDTAMFATMTKVLEGVISTLKIATEGVRVAVVTYNGQPVLSFGLRDYSDIVGVKKALRKMPLSLVAGASFKESTRSRTPASSSKKNNKVRSGIVTLGILKVGHPLTPSIRAKEPRAVREKKLNKNTNPTAQALQMVRERVLTHAAGARGGDGVQQIVVLLTKGQTARDANTRFERSPAVGCRIMP